MMKTKEIAHIVGLDVQTINSWVRLGHIEPAEKSGPGRGQSHRWTYKQALGLAVAVGIYKSAQGAKPPYIGQVVRKFENMRTPLFRAWLGEACLPSEMHGDEEIAKFVGPLHTGCDCDECQRARADLDRQAVHALERKMAAVIREKMGIAEPSAQDQLANRVKVLEGKATATK